MTSRICSLSVVVFVLLLAVGLSASKASAKDFSLLGGETLGVEDSALHAQIGFPEFKLRYHLPVLEDLEVIPTFGLPYNGTYMGGRLAPGDVVATFFGADLRYRLYQKGRFALALKAELAFFLQFADTGPATNTDPGIKIGLPGGVAASYRVSETFRATFGLNMPIHLLFFQYGAISYTGLGWPIELNVGGELRLTDRILLTLHIEFGPTVFAAEGGSNVEFHFAALTGMGYLF